jgi:hypothetical protein
MHLRSKVATLGALVCALGAVGYSMTAHSADHQDSPATLADPTADINDVFTFMDGANSAVFIMTVYPNAPTGAMFSNSVQYVMHTASAAAYGATTNPVDIIATFDASQNISLWVGSSEFVTGKASSTSGLASADGKVKVYAGLNADPFFFNLDGFKQTVKDVAAAAGDGGLPGLIAINDAGCPNMLGSPFEAGTVDSVLVTQLAKAPDGGAPQNHFGAFNTLAIVVEVDKSLVTAGGSLVSVWGATYTTASVVDAGGAG